MSRLYPDRPFLAASVAVFRDGKALLGARVGPPAPGVFSLPGGVVECGETLEEAALRELREETGVVAKIVGFAGHSEVIERDETGRVRRHFVVAAFAARWVSGEGAPSEETAQILWADPREAAFLPTTPGLRRILDAARLVLEHEG